MRIDPFKRRPAFSFTVTILAWNNFLLLLTLWGRKATIVTLIVVNEINFFKRMRFEAIHSNRYISPYEWPIASWFSVIYLLYICVQYNILFKYLLLSQMFPVAGFLKQYLRNQTSL